jgi:16S rRNA (guanine(1405)-N(7))-methyltransferase
MFVKEIIKDVKRKKELRELDDEFIKNRILEYDFKFSKFKNYEELKKSKEFKLFFKDLRRKLRIIYGMYWFKISKKDDFSKLLRKHPSTKERINYYNEIYNKIFEITGKPKKILDLGCGLNPLSYNHLNVKAEYFACDIGREVDIVKEFFKKNKIRGKAFKFDLISGDYSKLPKADVCFLFKVLESLESIKRNISKEIIKKINCKYIVASFAKKALGGKIEIRKKGRKWFRKMLGELGYSFKVIDIGEEIFFVIKKN